MNNVFLLSSANEHTYTFIDSLINEFSISADEIVVFLYDSDDASNFLFPDILSNVRVLYKSDSSIYEILRNSKTVTISSLNPENSKVVVDFNESGCLEYRKLCVRITDDEVDRWVENFESHSKLTISSKSLIDHNVLTVLDSVENFLCLDRPWGDLLRKILRRDINVINATPFGRVIPDPFVYEIFDGVVRKSALRQLDKESLVRVLLFTKPHPISNSMIILRRFAKELLFMKRQNSPKKIEFLVWKRRRIRHPIYFLIKFLCFVLARAKGFRIEFCEISPLPKESYLLTLYRCQYLILQSRGGLGAAFEFFRHGGQVIVESDSLNSEVFDNFPTENIVHASNKFKYIKYLMDDRVNNLERYFETNRGLARCAVEVARKEYRKKYKKFYG